jgi:hypothetical protein
LEACPGDTGFAPTTHIEVTRQRMAMASGRDAVDHSAHLLCSRL